MDQNSPNQSFKNDCLFRKGMVSKKNLRLELNIEKFIEKIKIHPQIFPQTKKYKNLHKGMVDENNYIVFRIHPRKKQITIISFPDAKRKPIH